MIKANYNVIYDYLSTHVREIYKGFDGGHDEKHFDEVYNTVRDLGKEAQFNDFEHLTLAVAAAFHDTGRIISDTNHEKWSVKILKNDININRWLTEPEIDLISQIILEHRSSKEATTKYSMVLKDADKISGLNRERWIERVVRYNYDYYNSEGLDLVINNIIKRFNKLCDPNHPKHNWISIYAKNLYGNKPIFDIPDKNEIMDYIKAYEEEQKYTITN